MGMVHFAAVFTKRQASQRKDIWMGQRRECVVAPRIVANVEGRARVRRSALTVKMRRIVRAEIREETCSITLYFLSSEILTYSISLIVSQSQPKTRTSKIYPASFSLLVTFIC
jgi:hypothetical protein